jgi:cephalosporin hydroxylase
MNFVEEAKFYHGLVIATGNVVDMARPEAWAKDDWWNYRVAIMEMASMLPSGSSVIDIGVNIGSSAMYFCASPNIACVTGIDPYGPQDETNVYFTRNILPTLGPKYVFMNRRSDQAYMLWEDDSVNLVCIDGDHSYDAVKKDIQLYLPKVKRGGILCGHDYGGNWEGVIRAVDEVVGKPDRVFASTHWLKEIR